MVTKFVLEKDNIRKNITEINSITVSDCM